MDFLKYYYVMFVDFLKALRKTAILQESRFLYKLNRKIWMTDYAAMPKENNKIIISFTTHKDRIFYVHYMLDSLFFQTIRPQEVRMYVARGEYKTFPDILKRFEPWLKIIEVEDIGSFKKFIPILKEVGEKDDKDFRIISVDDDIIYPPNFVARLLDLKEKNPSAMVTFVTVRNKKTGEPEGVGGTGILWNLEVFDPKILPCFFKKENFWDSMLLKNNDDMWISMFCKQKGVKICAVCGSYSESYRREYVPLPSEKMHALSSAPSALNIGKISLKPKYKKHVEDLVKKLLKEEGGD